jgi:hypothetical protein
MCDGERWMAAHIALPGHTVPCRPTPRNSGRARWRVFLRTQNA